MVTVRPGGADTVPAKAVAEMITVGEEPAGAAPCRTPQAVRAVTARAVTARARAAVMTEWRRTLLAPTSLLTCRHGTRFHHAGTRGRRRSHATMLRSVSWLGIYRDG